MAFPTFIKDCLDFLARNPCRYDFTGTQPMPRPTKPLKKMTQWEHIREITRLRAEANVLTVAAQTKDAQIVNLKAGASQDFNNLKGDLDRAREYQNALLRDIKNINDNYERQQQRAVTFARDLRAAQVTVAQQEREIANLRRLRGVGTGIEQDRRVFDAQQKTRAVEGQLATAIRERDRALRTFQTLSTEASAARAEVGRVNRAMKQMATAKLIDAQMSAPDDSADVNLSLTFQTGGVDPEYQKQYVKELAARREAETLLESYRETTRQVKVERDGLRFTLDVRVKELNEAREELDRQKKQVAGWKQALLGNQEVLLDGKPYRFGNRLDIEQLRERAEIAERRFQDALTRLQAVERAIR